MNAPVVAVGRTSKFSAAVRVGYLSQGIYLAGGLLLTPFILAHVGQHDYGLWLIAIQIVTYLAMLDLGVMGLLPRDVAYATCRREGGPGDQNAELATLVGRTATIALLQMPVVAIVAAAVWLVLPGEWREMRLPLALILLTYVVLFPARLFEQVLSGMQEQAFVGWARMAAWGASTTATVVLILNGQGMNALVVGWVLTLAVPSGACWWRLRRRHPGSLPRTLGRASWLECRDYLGRSAHVSIAQVAQTLVAATDVLIISTVISPAAVVPYVLTGKLLSMLDNQPRLFVLAAVPGLAQLRAEGETGRLAGVVSTLQTVLLVLTGGVICLVLMVNRAFVTWWVGPDQFGGMALTVALALLMALRHWNLSLAVSRFALGDERHIAYVTLVDGVVTTAAATVLVYALGPIGAPLGAMIGVCAISLPNHLAALSEKLGIPVRELASPVLRWMKHLLPIGAALLLLSRAWPPPTFLGLAAASTLAVVAYGVAFWPFLTQQALAPYVQPLLLKLRSFTGKPVSGRRE